MSRSEQVRRVSRPLLPALHLTAAVTHEGEGYVARCMHVEVTSQGETSSGSPSATAIRLATSTIRALAAAVSAHQQPGHPCYVLHACMTYSEGPSKCVAAILLSA